jgi:hypothetical protein
MFQPKKYFPPGFVSKKDEERLRRIKEMENDPEELERRALQAVEEDMKGTTFEE